MQLAVTGTRDWDLTRAAESAERAGSTLGLILRESRLEVWQVPDERHVHQLEAIMDYDEAEQNANRLTVARLTIPDDPGAEVWISDCHDEVLVALRAAVPDLHSFHVAETPLAELRASEREEGSIAPCTWNDLWFRSQTERRIGQALDRANVVFAPNASLRLGVTQDARENREPDLRDRLFEHHGIRSWRFPGVGTASSCPWLNAQSPSSPARIATGGDRSCGSSATRAPKQTLQLRMTVGSRRRCRPQRPGYRATNAELLCAPPRRDERRKASGTAAGRGKLVLLDRGSGRSHHDSGRGGTRRGLGAGEVALGA